MFILLLCQVSATCPEWKCKRLNNTICTQLHGYQVYVNDQTCPKDLFCKLDDFRTWSALESPSSTKSFNCTRQNYGGFDTDLLKGKQMFYCGLRNSADQLESGQHPKVCSQDLDCVTVGGWKSQCRCGLDGLKYCAPEIGSNAFDEYWENCYTEGSANDPKISAKSKAYWDFYYGFYVEIVSAPDCAKNLLWEFQILSDLDALRNTSGSMILELLAIAWFI